MKLILVILLISFGLKVCGQQVSATGKQAIQHIDDRRLKYAAISDSVWKYAEAPYKETRSAELIMKTFVGEGFTVTRNVINLPTVFIAEYGKGKPVIGLYGEYDSDENASNKMVPRHDELVKGGYGHGGHHNLLGVGALATAVAIKDLIKEGKLKGTIRYYGSTDEGGAGVRRFLSSEGYFNDLDFSMYWHPSPVTMASTGKWDAVTEVAIKFASADKVKVMAAYSQLQTSLTSIKDKSNTEYKFSYEPSDTTLNARMQCVTQGMCDSLYNKVDAAVKATAKLANVTGKMTTTRNLHQFLPNVTAMKVVQKNMELLGPLTYTEEEQKYVREMQTAINTSPDGISDKIREFSDVSKGRKMYGYGSDIGEASWHAPEAYFVVKTLPFVSMHTWQGTVFSGHPIGHKGMIQASKIMALTIIDYMQDENLQKAIKADFEAKKKFYRGK